MPSPDSTPDSTPRQQGPDSVPPDPGGILDDPIADASYLRDVCVAIFRLIVTVADADAGGPASSTFDMKTVDVSGSWDRRGQIGLATCDSDPNEGEVAQVANTSGTEERAFHVEYLVNCGQRTFRWVSVATHCRSQEV